MGPRLVKSSATDYTFFMPLILFVATVIHLAQSQPDTTGLEHYVFVREDTAETLHVLLDPKDLTQTNRVFLRVVLDAPWLPWDQRRIRIRISDYNDHAPELPREHDMHIREGWQENSGIEIESADGLIWVHKEEYDLAQRAGEIAATAAHADEAPSTVAPAGPAEVEETGLPGFWAQWWMHIAIVCGAVALSALVIWATMVRGPWRALNP